MRRGRKLALATILRRRSGARGWRRSWGGGRAGACGGSERAAAKRRERVTAKLAAGTTFGAVALEYVGKAKREGRAPATIAKLHWGREGAPPGRGRGAGGRGRP